MPLWDTLWELSPCTDLCRCHTKANVQTSRLSRWYLLCMHGIKQLPDPSTVPRD